MPIYEYTCAGCGAEFEKLTLATAGEKGGPEVACPSCGSKRVSKRFSTFGVKTSYVPLAAPAGGKDRAGGGGCCGGFCGCH
ncbi:MAG: zinc ribbon domain-containing protein [Candidatus Tectomicrobia bacterium]|nr:zinc ribbon domain-containing protein [Candidatus Tectomicrobia bacterium]